jgi:hypothetical protein
MTITRGRALSYQLINATEGGIAYTWSSIALQQAFINGDMPLPIVLCEERAPGEMLIRKSFELKFVLQCRESLRRY